MHFVILKTLAPIFIVMVLDFFPGRRGIIENWLAPILGMLISLSGVEVSPPVTGPLDL
jgi:hypothetical protein